MEIEKFVKKLCKPKMEQLKENGLIKVDISDVSPDLKKCAEILSEKQEKRIWDLLVLDESFCKILCHEKIRKIVTEIFGEKYHISSYSSNTICNDGYQSKWHTDHPYYNGKAPENLPKRDFLAIQFIIPLVDMTPENGCTRIGSEEKFWNAEAKFGEMIVMDSKTWHSAGVNTTDSPRTVLLINFCHESVPIFNIKGAKNFWETIGDNHKFLYVENFLVKFR